MDKIEYPEAWAEDARRLPLAFSQVREDPLAEQALVAELAPGSRLFLISSGGDTAALLVSDGRAAKVELVDINPAQLALTRFKIYLLSHFEPAERLALLGHLPMEPSRRAALLAPIFKTLDLQDDIFGPPELIAKRGPDHAGRYEMLFERLRTRLNDFSAELGELLAMDDPFEQVRRVAVHTPFGRELDAAFSSVMHAENLIALFGQDATRKPLFPFGEYFASRTRHALASGPACENPFLAQMLGGGFLNARPYPWLDAPVKNPIPEVIYTCSTAIEALEKAGPHSFDFIHLSNILDWLDPAKATKTLDLAWEALTPGGLLLIRQLNSSLEIPLLEPRLEWRGSQAALLGRRDRSFFYRACHVGCKKG
ncbi:MAG: hypothetical protein JWL90_4560 [Chthoniobacteraceae bacterium]|nr:hypothetical protein [Chthoniobacteraceae bacterium]